MSAKISLLSMALAALTLIPATAANAQSVYVNTASSLDARLQYAQSGIDSVRARGMISQAQYDHLLDRISRIHTYEGDLSMGRGLPPQKQAELSADLQSLDSELAALGIGVRQVAVVRRPLARVYTRTTVKRITPSRVVVHRRVVEHRRVIR